MDDGRVSTSEDIEGTLVGGGVARAMLSCVTRFVPRVAVAAQLPLPLPYPPARTVDDKLAGVNKKAAPETAQRRVVTATRAVLQIVAMISDVVLMFGCLCAFVYD